MKLTKKQVVRELDEALAALHDLATNSRPFVDQQRLTAKAMEKVRKARNGVFSLEELAQ